jgi:hypothetical protein
VSTAEEILEIIRAVKSPWLGINLDTGNFNTDDPYADLVKIAPYAVNVHMKGEVSPRGKGRRTRRPVAPGENPPRRQLPGLRRTGIRIERRFVDGGSKAIETDEGIVCGVMDQAKPMALFGAKSGPSCSLI